MPDAPDPKVLEALEARIKAARAPDTKPEKHENEYQKASMAWRMVIELVVGMVMGMGAGYGLDSLFGTLPIFLILFSLLGFAAGIRVMMGTAMEMQNKKPGADGPETNETPEKGKNEG